MKAWAIFDRVLTVALLFMLTVFACHAAYSILTDAPVQPTWSWGMWAFAAYARHLVNDIQKWSKA